MDESKSPETTPRELNMLAKWRAKASQLMVYVFSGFERLNMLDNKEEG